MADLKLNGLSSRGDSQRGTPGPGGARFDGPGTAGPGALRARLRGAAAALSPAALWRGHRLFTILVLLSLVPRVLAALSFRPALLSADSFLYMQGAVTGRLGVIRPSGYSFFLSPFQVLPHALLAVTTVQHLMGIAIAVIVYALLRYWGLPGWGAALAAVPTLFDSRQIALESFILPDTVFCLVLLLAVALLLTKRAPRAWQCAVAGLLLAYASVLRGNGIPLVVIVAAFLLVRKVGWRACVAAGAAFAVPLLGYVLAFHSQYGRYNLTSSDGIFLWSRTTSFANCAVIRPPANLRPLCPNLEKSVRVPPPAPWSASHLLSAPQPQDYLWARDVWWRNNSHPGINPANDKLGREFAIRAIEAQPLDYLRVVSRDVLLTFVATDRPIGASAMTFTPKPRIASLPSYYRGDIRSFAGTTSNTHAVRPYSWFLFLYQQPVFFPGLVLLLVLLAGLAGVLRNWRRWGGIQGLPWALAAISIVSPALLTQSLYRYAIVAIPLACLAAGLNFARLPGRRPWRPGLAGGPEAGSGASAAGAASSVESASAADAGHVAVLHHPAKAATANGADAADAADRANGTDGTDGAGPTAADTAKPTEAAEATRAAEAAQADEASGTSQPAGAARAGATAPGTVSAPEPTSGPPDFARPASADAAGPTQPAPTEPADAAGDPAGPGA